MRYQTIDDYLEKSQVKDELWLVDSSLFKELIYERNLKKFSIKVKLPKEIFKELNKSSNNDKKIIDDIEKITIIQNIINQNKDYEFLQNSQSITNEIKTFIDNYRLNPSIQKYLENNQTVFKDKALKILEQYKEKCVKSNLIDKVDQKVINSEKKITLKNQPEKIVIFGEFFNLSEIELKLLKKTSQESKFIFIGKFSESLEKYFETENYLQYYENIKSYFYSNKKRSIYNELKEINFNGNYFAFSDWDQEIKYIAQEIRKKVEEKKISYSEFAIYLPDKELYSFKIEKYLNDFKIPYFTTYGKKIIDHPINNFINYLLNLDLNKSINIFNIIKANFTNIDFSDFSIPEDINLILEEEVIETPKDLFEFDYLFLENIFYESGIFYPFANKEKVIKKISTYFIRNLKNDFKNKAETKKEYAKTIIFYKYFLKKLKFLKKINDQKLLPNDFFNNLMRNLKELNINRETKAFKLLIDTLKKTINFLIKIDNKKYSVNEYLKFYKYFSDEAYFDRKDKFENKVLITELPIISKVNIKNIYHVGLTNKYFPSIDNNSLGNLNSIFRPIQNRDKQLLSFLTILNKKINYYPSFPKIINNEENEPSEIIIELGLEEKIKNFYNQGKFSNSQKNEFISSNPKLLKTKHPRINDLLVNRNDNKWTKYEGLLEEDKINFKKKTSISKIEEYAACPMKYFFNRKIGIKAKTKINNDLEANIKGTLIHSILENYYIKLKKNNLIESTLDEKKFLLMEKEAKDIFSKYTDSFDNLYLDNLINEVCSGLKGETKKGLLYKVLEIDQKNIERGILPNQFEFEFEFEMEGFNFGGIIDRIDENKYQFEILDYKTGEISASVKANEIKQGLAYQLPIYSLAYQEKLAKDNIIKEVSKAGYYKLKKIEEVKVDFSIKEKNKVELIEKTKENLIEIKENLKKGKYNYTTNDRNKVCKYCDYYKICRYDSNKIHKVLSKKLIEYNNLDEYILDEKTLAFPQLIKKEIKKDNEPRLTKYQKKALSVDKNITVTAGAGAGKTEVLTNRMLELIKETKGEIDKILVITFTNKATSEMRNRIYSALVNAINSGEDSNGYLLKAKLNFYKNWVSTIDSFYMRLLKDYSFDLGIKAEISMTDENEVQLFKYELIEEIIDKLAKEKSKDLQKLLEIWKRKQILNNFINLVDTNHLDNYFKQGYLDEVFDDYDLIYKKEPEKLLKKLNNNKAIDLIVIDLPKLKITAAINHAREVLKEYIRTGKTSDVNLKLLKTSPSQKIDPDDYKTIKKLIDGTNKFFLMLPLKKLEKEYLKSFINIFKIIKEKYQIKKAKKEIFTFNDLSNDIYKFLKEDINNFREKLSDKFTYIMIDEFQDTNSIQYEIAKYLSGWDGKNIETISPDKLFFVGDEKQAIYSFRGGDVQVFNKAKNEIEIINKTNDKESGMIEFPDNFRSSKNIIDFFNLFFAEVLKKDGEKWHSYEAQPQRLNGHKEKGSINFFIFNKGSKQKKELRQNENMEASFIAKQIKKILAHNKNESIAILFRTKKNLSKFTKELDNLSINYVITGGKNFYQNQEVFDICNLLSFLNDKSRKIELVGFLRSTMVCLSDPEIKEISNDLIEGLKNKHNHIYELIYGSEAKKGWLELSKEKNIYELIEIIIKDTNYLISIHHQRDNNQIIGNIERLIEIAYEKRQFTLNEFVEFIDFQIENKIPEKNATLIKLGEEQPVQLMTIHASKGLGFDTVFLADSCAEGYKMFTDTINIGEISEQDKNYVGFKVPDDKSFHKFDSIIKKGILSYEHEKELAELKRLLYVALTRVKNNLIISAEVFNKLPSQDTFMSFICNYFDELKGLVNTENENYLPIKLKEIDFYIFNQPFDSSN